MKNPCARTSLLYFSLLILSIGCTEDHPLGPMRGQLIGNVQIDRHTTSRNILSSKHLHTGVELAEAGCIQIEKFDSKTLWVNFHHSLCPTSHALLPKETIAFSFYAKEIQIDWLDNPTLLYAFVSANDSPSAPLLGVAMKANDQMPIQLVQLCRWVDAQMAELAPKSSHAILNTCEVEFFDESEQEKTRQNRFNQLVLLPKTAASLEALISELNLKSP